MNIDEKVALRRLKGFYGVLEENNDATSSLIPEDIGKVSENIIRETYRKLKIIHPKHNLLSLVAIHPNGGGIEFTSKFHRKFTRVDDDWSSRAYERYQKSLEKALDKEIKNYRDN